MVSNALKKAAEGDAIELIAVGNLPLGRRETGVGCWIVGNRNWRSNASDGRLVLCGRLTLRWRLVLCRGLILCCCAGRRERAECHEEDNVSQAKTADEYKRRC